LEPPQLNPSAHTVVRPRPTRSQRFWWGYLAFYGAFAVAGFVGVVYEVGVERGFWLALLGPGLLVGVGAHASGKRLRQSRTATATTISVSTEGELRVLDPEGESAESLAGAQGFSIVHGPTVTDIYGAKVPSSLGSSAPYGAVLIDRDGGRRVLVFAGELPEREQRVLLAAARTFLAPGAISTTPAPTPDEYAQSASFPTKIREFSRMMGVILLLLLPVYAVMVIQTAMRGHLDPNTLWFSILLVVAGAVVAIVLIARALRRRR